MASPGSFDGGGTLIELNYWSRIICHVLIIEDEPFFALDLQGVLEAQGATSFDCVDTHVDAVAAAVARRPAVITSDVHLYDGKGPDAVAEIRRLIGPIPVIFITATPQDCLEIVAGDAVMNKPIDRDALRAEFDRVRR
ncbi:response regulator [Sphingomonas sp. UYEF23]|uniref:response regulator n=1 Tax=Sphingomonas sp. UYEF23 TaxID=1756408 RepID=UPI003390BEEB